MKRVLHKQLLFVLVLVAAVGGVVIALSMHVDTSVTRSDAETLDVLLADLERPPPGPALSWPQEVALIQAVQRRVLDAAPENKGIPQNESREPADLVEYGYGLCYDRSRVIEKALTHVGFEVRHLAAYALHSSKLRALATPGHPSHALSEVKTQRGWVLVDSNSPYIGVDAELEPISANDLLVCGAMGPQKDGHPDPLRGVLGPDFFFIYGLYSRHGRFYPPYVPVPDVNFGQLLDNLESEPGRCRRGLAVSGRG